MLVSGEGPRLASSLSAGLQPGRQASLHLVLVPLAGTGLVLLGLYLLAVALAEAGLAPPGLVAALDPADDDSLLAIWAALQLILAIGATLVAARRPGRLLASLPALAVLMADGIDLPARLAELLTAVGLPLPPAKLLADLAVGALVLLPAVTLACQEDPRLRCHGRACFYLIVAAGAGSVTLDLAGQAATVLTAEVVHHLIESAEELVDLVLATCLAALLLSLALKRETS